MIGKGKLQIHIYVFRYILIFFDFFGKDRLTRATSFSLLDTPPFIFFPVSSSSPVKVSKRLLSLKAQKPSRVFSFLVCEYKLVIM